MEKEVRAEADKDSEDSDDDVQPKRKRLKVDTENLLHIKWRTWGNVCEK